MEKEKTDLLEDKLSVLIASHKSISEKLVYYILAISTACIGFAVNQTQSLKFGYDKIFLLAALFLWLMSFYFGLSIIRYIKLATTVNIELLKARILDRIQLVEQHQSKLLELQKKLYRTEIFQGLLLGIGIFFYIVWYIVNMVNNA